MNQSVDRVRLEWNKYCPSKFVELGYSKRIDSKQRVCVHSNASFTAICHALGILRMRMIVIIRSISVALPWGWIWYPWSINSASESEAKKRWLTILMGYTIVIVGFPVIPQTLLMVLISSNRLGILDTTDHDPSHSSLCPWFSRRNGNLA